MAHSHSTDWERFARQNPLWYIWTDFNGDEAAFWASGQKDARQILAQTQAHLPATDKVIEIGAGVGRLLAPMSATFAHCVGVDIAPTMLQELQRYWPAHATHPNLAVYEAHQPWETQPADLIYSLLVFQHLETWSEISSYIQKIARALKPGGVACLQFDTRPQNWRYKLRNHLPDSLLPKPWRRGIRRIRRRPADLLASFAAQGLNLLQEHKAHSAEHIFVLQKP